MSINIVCSFEGHKWDDSELVPVGYPIKCLRCGECKANAGEVAS